MSTLRAQGQRPSQTRNATSLNHKLDRQLAAYMAAAGAAGVATLALVQPAEAKVVYTSANINIGFNRVAIDLNNDGTNDFYFIVGGGGSNEVFLYVSAPNGNGWFGNSQAQPAFFGVPSAPEKSSSAALTSWPRSLAVRSEAEAVACGLARPTAIWA
jgi:hypothetical protein